MGWGPEPICLLGAQEAEGPVLRHHALFDLAPRLSVGSVATHKFSAVSQTHRMQEAPELPEQRPPYLNHAAGDSCRLRDPNHIHHTGEKVFLNHNTPFKEKVVI